MNVTLLDALSPELVGDTVQRAVALTGRLGPIHTLRDERFAPCQGCFECWVTHPGTCKVKDDANAVMRDIIGADEIIWALRPRLGCWDSVVKQALDRSIGLILPFFTSVEGETHHPARYPRFPRTGVVAVYDGEPPAEDVERLRRLVARNTVNMHSRASWVAVVRPDASIEEVADAITTARGRAHEGFLRLAPFHRQGTAGVGAHADGSPRRALLVVASAKPAGQSTSEALGRAVLDRLAARGWSVDVAHLAALVKLSRTDAPGLERRVEASDLVIFATPVYVDCIPAVGLAALERLADGHIPRDGRPAMLPIVHCGCPELEHTALALEVLAAAADQLGWGWAGHLAVGGGGVLTADALAAGVGPAAHAVAAIDATVEALDRGLPVPMAATAEFALPYLSASVYRLAGSAGWLWHAWQNGALLDLGARPFEAADG